MNKCYHSSAVFKDEVFDLRGKEIGFMWEMLCKRGKDLQLEFEILEVEGDQVKARWEAHYTFSATRRKVHNIIDSRFTLKDGLIIEHHDEFNFWRWSRQALGLPGYILGWSAFLKNKVQSQAADSLNAFISSHSHNKSK